MSDSKDEFTERKTKREKEIFLFKEKDDIQEIVMLIT